MAVAVLVVLVAVDTFMTGFLLASYRRLAKSLAVQADSVSALADDVSDLSGKLG